MWGSCSKCERYDNVHELVYTGNPPGKFDIRTDPLCLICRNWTRAYLREQGCTNIRVMEDALRGKPASWNTGKTA